MKKTWKLFVALASLVIAMQNLYAQDTGICVPTPCGGLFSPPPDTLKLGVILVQFSDWATNTDARGGVCLIHPFPQNLDDYTYQMYYDFLFSANYRSPTVETHDAEQVFGSMQEFYKEMSYNKFTVVGDIINPHPNPNATPTFVTLRQTKSWWSTNNPGPRALLDSALAVSQYSINGYDKIAVIYAGVSGLGAQITGYPGKTGCFVYQITERIPLNRGRTQTLGRFEGIGTHAHEFGHALGLDDQKGAAVRVSGLSNFELMAVGNQGFMDGNHLNASLGGFHAPTPLSGYSKLKLGWATYEAINSDGPIIFPSLDETDRICVRFINDSNPNDWDEGEYFFFDNRRPLLTNGTRTFDGDMMNGLLIWHHANSNFSHNGLRFDVEEANGLDEVGTYIGSSKNEHLFPGAASNYTAFTPYTNPNSNKQDGTRSGFALTCIKVNGSGASAYVTANAYLNFYTGSWSGNVTTNTAWGSTVTVTTNVTVNSGVTLTIDPGAVIQFASGTSLTVNGKLVADSNDPTKRITFTGTTQTAGFWNGITINSGSSTNVSTLRRCDVQYAVTGININYTGNSNNVTVEKCKIRYSSADGFAIGGNNYSGATVHPLIKDNTISNNYIGFELYDYAKPTITGNRIESNSSSGLFADSNCNATIQYNYISGNSQYGLWFVISSNAEAHRNTIKSNGTRGIICASNSNVIACGANTDTTKGRNEITGNTGVGIYASSSSPNFGKDLVTLYGNNWIHDNTSFEAQQASAGYQIHAKRGYWSGQQSNVSGAVYTSPALSSAPSPVGWGRSASHDPTLRIWREDDFDLQHGPIIAPANMKAQFEVAAMMPVAVESAIANNWTTDLQMALDAGLKTGDWSAASELIAALHIELQNARVPNVDLALVNTYANDARVAAFIRKMLALVLMENDLVAKNISAALAKLTAFSASNPENTAEFLLNRGALHLHRQNDFIAA